MRVAVAARLLAGDQRVGGDVDERRERRIEQRHRDVLALARGVAAAQRGQDPDRGVVAREHVDHRHARPWPAPRGP
jgi:hypothetical protein